MTFNFWPFNCEAKLDRKVVEESISATSQAILKVGAVGERDDSPPVLQWAGDSWQTFPLSTTCEDCGGLFAPGKLESVIVVRVFLRPQHPVVVSEKPLCKKCLPVANLEVHLAEGSGASDDLDTLYFSTKEGYLEHFSFDGQEQTLIAIEDYNHLYCEICNVLIGSKTTKCRKCSTPQS